MEILQVSERIIRNNYRKIEEIVGKKLYSNESEIFVNEGKTFKIIKPIYRPSRLNNLYLFENEIFPHANNIIKILYQGDKFIGVCTEYLEKFKSLKNQLNELDLYEIKLLFSYILEFIEKVHSKNLDYWDIHLENMGTSNNKFSIIDIDSIIKIESQQNIQYCYNNLLTLFYELCFQMEIRILTS